MKRLTVLLCLFLPAFMSGRIARKLYDEVHAELTALVEDEYAGLKDAMDTARVPYTPGRGLQN